MISTTVKLSEDEKNCVEATACLGTISTLLMCLHTPLGLSLKVASMIAGSITAAPTAALCVKTCINSPCLSTDTRRDSSRINNGRINDTDLGIDGSKNMKYGSFVQ